METIEKVNFSSICRFCLIKLSELKNFIDIPNIHIVKDLILAEVADGLPQNICAACNNTIEIFLEFVKKAKDSYNQLRLIYEAAQEKTWNLSEEDDCDNDSIYSDSKEKIVKVIKTEDESLNKELPTKRLKPVICKNCKLSFESKKQLMDHRKGIPCEWVDYKCSDCNKIFKDIQRLKSHSRSHTKEAPFKCLECDKTFKFQQNLKRHILIHRGVKKFTCDECGKAFSRAHVLNEHRNIHTGHNPYICNYCGQGFKRYANHFIHVHRHKLLNGEITQSESKKPYLQIQCDVCNKVFASRSGLENHMTLHQDEPVLRMFLCKDCGKAFKTNAQLISHTRTHTGDRPFECKDCGKKFKHMSAFNNHKTVHSGERPYHCKECDRFFTQGGHLKVHMRVHSGEKPFPCNLCPKKFASNSNLKVHIRTHTGEKPYVCCECGKGYFDSTSLRKHKKTHIARESEYFD